MDRTITKGLTLIAVVILGGIFLYLVFRYIQPEKCEDFKHQREAQKYFDKDTIKWQRLDRDNDGLPCESLPW